MGRPKITRTCENCGRLLHKSQYKYCSLQCQHDKQWKITKEKIEQAGRFPCSTCSNKPARRYFIERYGTQCMICKSTTWRSKDIPLVLDHIDGNPMNWSIENLQLVCPNCDAQLPTYKGKNRGHGRHSRMIRYHSGKSY